MDYRNKVIAACENNGTKNFIQNIFIKNDSEKDEFIAFLDEFHPEFLHTAETSSTEDLLDELEQAFDENAVLFADVMLDYVDSSSKYKEDFELLSLLTPDEDYGYAFLTDLGRSGSLIQVARSREFKKSGDYPGYISDDFTEKLVKLGFENEYDGVFKTDKPRTEAERLLDEIMKFNDDLQTLIKDNGLYFEMDIEPSKKDEKGKEEKKKTKTPVIDEDDEASSFFGFNVQKKKAETPSKPTGFSMPETDEESDEETLYGFDEYDDDETDEDTDTEDDNGDWEEM